jgi:2-oxoglutarate dehydrogenase E2 component (dihydrolipoamide succinyltransferase)
MSIEVTIPAVGESIHEVQIAQWLKSEGDWVDKDESLVEVESDKATVQLPAPAAGRLAKILKQRGEIAQVGQAIAQLESDGKEPAETRQPAEAKPKGEKDKPQAQPAAAKQTEPPPRPTKRPEERGKPQEVPAAPAAAAAKRAPPEPATIRDGGEKPNAKAPELLPATRRLLTEFELTPDAVRGSGPEGQILPEDVLRHIREARETGKELSAKSRQAEKPAAALEPAEAPADLEELVPMSMIRRRIAERLVEAQHAAALLTTFNEIDMSQVMELRSKFKDAFAERYGVKLGFMSFFVKAAIEALKRYPQVNAEIRGHDIAYRNYYDIGIAVGGGKGLVVPVLRRAELLSFAEIEQQIAQFAALAKENKLKPEDLQGGTFTISNGGIYGSLLSTPIVNPPQSGILGLHAIQDRPVAREKQVVIRPMMYVALTYDHRLVDGREAVGFLKTIKDVIEDPTRLLLEV